MDICSALYGHPEINTAGKSVLDMGCGHTSIFPYLYHCFKIKNYSGVDNKPINDLFGDPDNNPIYQPGFERIINMQTCYQNKEENLTDFYSLYHSTSKKFIEPNKILSKVEFSKCFEYYPFGARSFLRNNKQVFDFIIISNFLHLFSRGYAKKLYNSFRNIIAYNGFIYIKVANDQHTRRNGTKVKWGLTQNELQLFVGPIQNNPVINNSGSSISILFQVN